MKDKVFHHFALHLWVLVGLCIGPWAPRAVGAEGEEQVDLDYIKRKRSHQMIGTKITQDDYLFVIGRYKNITQKVPSWDVEEVTYAEGGEYYVKAKNYEKKGKFLSATKFYRKAFGAMKGKKWAQEYCNYGMGNGLYRAQRFEPWTDKKGRKYQLPSAYFAAVLKANPKSRFALDAVVKRAICLAEEGQLAESEQAFQTAKAFIKKYKDEVLPIASEYRNVADRARALAALGRARMLERKADKQSKEERDYSPALSAYKSTQSIALGKFSNIYAEAVDGELNVLVGMKDYDSARDRAQSLIEKFNEKSDADLIPILPGAYSSLGQANYALALEHARNHRKLQSARAFTEARWSFLHVIVQFFDRDEHVARAHYFSGLCCEKLAQQESDALEKARRHWQAVVDEFPKSVFVPLARKKLEALAPATPGAEEEKKPEKEKKSAAAPK